jgi:outer membrane protein assembly factor BamB
VQPNILSESRSRFALALAAAILSPLPVAAEDWPQWRGPGRDGAWHETRFLEQFPADGLKVRWRAEAGWGLSSPVVATGRVYLHDSELTAPKAKERLRCFDENSGRILWTHAYDVTYPDWAFDPAQEIGPVATPVVHGGKLYAVGRVGHLFCLDAAKGDVLWQKNLEQDYQTSFAPGMPSPLVEGNLLIVFAGGKSDACVVALNKDTGIEAWKSLDEKLTPSSPIVIAAGGKRQLIVWTQESVTSLDPASGKTWWRQPLATSNEYAVSTPVFDAGRLLIGGLMLQMDADQPAASVLWPKSSAPARRIFSHTSTALISGDYLFTAKSSGELIGVDAKTGKQLWTTDKVTDLKGGACIHLTLCGDFILLFNDRGELIRAKLTDKGYEEISRALVIKPTFPFAGRNLVWPPPAYANGHIFARSGKELVCASLAAEPE